MSPANRMRLMALSEREFQREYRAPTQVQPQRKFKSIQVNLSKLDGSWDRKRGAAARFMAIILRNDDEALRHRITESETTIDTYSEGAKWLRREATYLEKTARMMNTAAGRISTVLARAKSDQDTAAA